MLRSIVRLFNPLPPLEEFAQSGWATTCSPDDIIVASLLDSFAKEPDLWETQGTELPSDKLPGSGRMWTHSDRKDLIWNKSTHNYLLLIRQGDRPIRVISELEVAAKDKDGCGPWLYRHSNGGVVVNDVTLEETAGLHLIKQMSLLEIQRRKAREAADEAMRLMRLNEKKWIMAEGLLGMKRNEHGALVPEVQEGE